MAIFLPKYVGAYFEQFQITKCWTIIFLMYNILANEKNKYGTSPQGLV